MAAALIESISNSARGPHPLNKIKYKKRASKKKRKERKKRKRIYKGKEERRFGASTIKKKSK
jgi:hypothetical protein